MGKIIREKQPQIQEHVHLFGHSWGGMLAMEYALTKPTGVHSLILADTLASYPQYISEVNRLREELPAEVQKTLQKHERAGTTDDSAYEKAVMFFYKKHFCRLDPWPNPILKAVEKFKQTPEVYLTMNGPSEFYITGTLKDWNIVNRLGEINIPTLLLSGRYDEVTPAVMETIYRGIQGSEWHIFEKSSHLPHLAESELYFKVLINFLNRVEAKK